MTRGHALGLFSSALLLSDCARGVNPLRVGSKSSPENATIAEIYALALERTHIPVRRYMNLGDSETAMTALQRGEIDLYPEYVRKGLDNREKVVPVNGVTWLEPSPAFDSPCLATSPYAAQKYWLLTLKRCARIARQLRFAGSTRFIASGALDRLRRAYGGFEFRNVIAVRPGEQYDALGRGDAEVANAFTTDSRIAERQLIVLRDDKRVWAHENIAPAIRVAAIHAHPRVPAVLNGISRRITEYAVQQLNLRLDLLDMDPRDAAEGFIAANMPRV
ncbi:MAG TPA: glycine betaine ABC transporter substrate-binding protein [Candidatus Rubrimentiphilum sp.]|nr:glycine betaine ABC transporter substrate-binding protein [Candidatus Rubrimentiphilum sp.]